MSDRIEPISKIKRVSRVKKLKLKLHKRKTLKGMYFDELLSKTSNKKETDSKEQHVVDKLC